MRHGSPSPGVVGSELIRLLAGLARAPAAGAPAPVFAERLGGWLDWTGAIALAGALAATPAGAAAAAPPAQPASELAEAERACERAHAALAATIAGGALAQRPADADDFAPYRRHARACQQAMHDGVAVLRQRLRDALARHSARGARLAAIDAVLDRGLAARERFLLERIVTQLQAHHERLRRAADAGWQAAYTAEMQRVLRAELAHRMGPARGLLDALRQMETR
ncbi:MAG: DUF3348 family protein [Burkholderiales bacterium]|nr:DUF3348 family protein [Burkholderiales bacterium]